MSAEEKLLSRSSIVSDKRREQKSLMQDSDGDSSSRRANHSTDSVCLHSDKYNDGASCGAGTSNNLGQEVEIADGVTISGSEGLCSDNEDKQLEFKKCSRYLGTSNHELTSSSSDKYQDGDEKIFKSNKRDESDEARAPSVPTSPESDVEEDVKVCDICGDAGREDLLAVCSRCSDGAEHTYCMREMLDKVPEVDWLCEECKHNELLEARQLDQSKKIVSHERNKPLGRTCSLLPDLSLKLDNKDPACDRLRLRNLSLSRQSSSKICGERMDSCSAAKKQILESSVSSPTTSSPNRMAGPSKDVPFKILDNIKGKPSNQISTGTEITGEFSENAHSPTTNSPHFVKGNFLKSNSFSSSNSRQNVKVSEDVIQKHSVDAKEGIGKSIGPISKSMSFKGLGRSSSTEPKVKMLPANCAPFQDLKGPKHGKDRTYERKNTMKLDNSLPGQIAADSTNRSSAVSDGISTLPVTSTRDYRNVQSDGKLPNMSNHAGHLAQKSSDIMRNLGEAKKLSTGIVGSTYVNGTSNAVETKFNHLNTNDGLAVSSSRPVDGSLNADGARSNGQGSQNEKAPEKSSGCSRQGLNSGSRRRLPLDASALKSKDGMPGENKLKAAIEAAMQKKQDILKKNKIPEKPVELPISNKQGNHGGDAVSNHVKDPKSEEAMHEGDMDLHDTNLDSSIQIPIIGEKPIQLYPADFEKSPAGESVLTQSAIPEQESIWQGGFEIHRNGKPPDMRGGFQAHMSLFASGKVHEMVGKFPKKIIFNEVPRPCAWPAQFKELGPREDHIALYFFAKDSESYMRSYKILVDYMMKHDLALKGNINGVELLVFPSNHLPHESKCWNTLYFIWGVFRGRRPRLLDDRFSLGKCEISVLDKVVLHKGVMPAENPFLYNKPAPEQLSVSGSNHNLVSRCEASVEEGSSLQLCASLSNGDCFKEEYSVGRTCMNSAIGAGNHKKRPKNHDTILREACPETGSAVLGEQCQGKHRRMVDLQKLTAEVNKDKSLPSEVTLDQQDCSQPLKLPLVGKQEVDTVVSSVNLEVLDSESDYVSRLKYDNGLKPEKRCLVTMQTSSLMELENDINKKEDTNCLLKNRIKLSEGYVDINISVDNNRVQYSPKRHFHEGSDAAASITGKKRPWVDKIDMAEDAVSKSTNFSGCNLYTLEAQMGDVSSKSHIDSCGEADNEKPNAITPWSSEGGFFLDGVKREDGSFPLEVASSENEDRDCLPGEAPNLELALGVKKKQVREGALRFGRKDPDEVASSIEEDGDASASLSLSLGFPFLDKESMARSPSPPATAALNQRVNTSLLLFRGSSGK